MKKIKFYVSSFFMVAMISLLFTNCSNNDSSQTSKVTIRMVDAPGDYDEVNVEVLDVLIKDNSNTDDQGWISIGDKTQVGEGKIYNLLDLTGGVNVLLADNDVPSGYLGQVRLLLGDENTIVLKGSTNAIPLKTPSAQQSGLKLKVNQTLEAGKSYEFLLDFDVKNSVVKAGNSGNYNLHPVIRVSTKENTGGIKGVIISPSPFPTDFVVLVSIPIEGGTITTFMKIENGMFQLNGVPTGVYTVTLDPGATSIYATKTIENVVVINGAITDVGDQSFVLKP
ncbi:DUF4382 domain-containing protein [Flavobacterium sp. K5-23]|uniref:DUF4382 domain-containing protein n=1 Tax=Flavobacterium sp. K5-23 TaxID=2746225 RepID=UPI00200FA2B5|nr:DUF4382 domain-containing protein [Flavobacterium sp. K5-23]UQD55482.1 DUF4382 domain-containing protein [Flavobacterium sp. K5-23]